jgi:hypothetical protein
MAVHEQSVGATDEWYTPPYVFDALGCTFNMDVANPGHEVTPWIPARRFLTCHGLAASSEGFIWMNAPFGARNGLTPWLAKFCTHANGIALVPARASAPWWEIYVARADLVLFTAKKIKFINANGTLGASPGQGTTLLAIGQQGREALERGSANELGMLRRPIKLSKLLP